MKPLSPGKRLAFTFITAILTWLVIEVVSAAYLFIETGHLASLAPMQTARQKIITGYDAERQQERIQDQRTLDAANQAPSTSAVALEEVLHPYLGYVMRYADRDCPTIGFCDDAMRGNAADLFTRAPDTFYVGLFGGSFGQGVSINSTPGKLEAALSTLPGIGDRKVVVRTLALGGFKQPQQLLAFNYFLVQGMPFDAVINIDGYNEMVLPITEGILQGTHPIFPRSWARRLVGSYDKNMLLMLARVERLKEKRAGSAMTFSSALLRYSQLANLYWQHHDERLDNAIKRTWNDFVSYRSRERFRTTFAARGPDYPREPGEDTVDDLVSIWSNSSRQMASLAKASNIDYYHFLQPNQYVDGSKPMSDEERRIAIVERGPGATLALENYRALSEEGKQLVHDGVLFFDLTEVYKDHPEPLYRDACCHVNQRGYDLIIDAMVERILSTNGSRFTDNQ
ncbi:MAG: hypothetical protein DHS20C01_04300 [marine bacterium B5-7]|nr:MAG: hypothetical protein DHS20C01_04300 [marine bacterium B5-7]